MLREAQGKGRKKEEEAKEGVGKAWERGKKERENGRRRRYLYG